MLDKIERRPLLWAFLLSLILGAVIFLPFVIIGKGIFFYYGDYNVQQIPFYQLVHRSIKSGDVNWNWFTDLGANFIGSYSFYNLFSPFFWLTLPFPNSVVPYLMAPLLILKTACAALTSAALLCRFVTSRRFAVLGALLYAFSGYTTYNIFFNHFHEVIVVFPLLLLGLELLVVEKRGGLFAMAVAINCMINYWFFIGSAVFAVIYFLVRTFSGGWEMNFKTFLRALLEGVLGVVLAAVVLLPSAMAILGNPRTTGDNILYGWEFWLYDRNQRIPAIISSIFFPPDIPSRPNFFPENGAKWASLSAWLPMVGPTFVLGYLFASSRTWLRRMLIASFFIALFPGLNSMFILFNNSYYARWFYMPVLFMALASAVMLERLSLGQYEREINKGFWFTSVITLLIAAAIALTPMNTEEDSLKIGLMEYPERFWLYVAITAFGLVLTGLIIWKFPSGERLLRAAFIMLPSVCVVYAISMLALGTQHSDEFDFLHNVALKADRIKLQHNVGQFDRSDIYDDMDNLGMYWRLPNIQAFHSVVPTSIMEFYPSVGVKRDVSSKPQPEFFELRSLLSVRWLFVRETDPEDMQPSTKNFKFVDRQLGFNIYENEDYLPMGLPMEYYITREQFEAAGEQERRRLLLKGVLLEDEDIEKLSAYIDPMPEEVFSDTSEEQYNIDVDMLARKTFRSRFYIQNSGFNHTIDLNRGSVLFYSVPFEKGWSATVNGEAAEVYKVDNGFLGVWLPQGSNDVVFKFRAPGLIAGAFISLLGVLAFIIYLLIGRQLSPVRRARSRGVLPPRDKPEGLPLHAGELIGIPDSPLGDDLIADMFLEQDSGAEESSGGEEPDSRGAETEHQSGEKAGQKDEPPAKESRSGFNWSGEQAARQDIGEEEKLQDTDRE